MALTPADVKAIMNLRDSRVRDTEISARLCIAITEVRKVIAEHAPVAPMDVRVEAIVRDALASTRQRTRTLGERLKLVLAECTEAVRVEREERAVREAEVARKAKLTEREQVLQAELAEIRAALRGKKKPEAS